MTELKTNARLLKTAVRASTGGLNVISLFNGMNTCRQALENQGFKVNKYYSSEIKPYAIELTQKHFPDTIQVGDITKWKEWDIDWKTIDFIGSGSPCQDLSAAGKRAGINGERSSLFFVFIEILNHVKSLNPNVKFLQENVATASKLDVGIMSRELGVYPVKINSRLVTAQDRDRYYWTNIKTKETMFDIVTDIPQPKDRNIVLADILKIPIVNDRSKNIIMEIKENQVRVRKHYIKQSDLANYLKSYKNKNTKEIANYCGVNLTEAAHWFRTDTSGSIPKDIVWSKIKECLNIENDTYDKAITEFEIKNGSYDMAKRIYHTDGKHPTLMTITGGHQNKNITDGKDLFYLKPEHWELLQGFNINYTAGLSNNKRKSLLGDGWTLPIVEHIFSFMHIA